MQCALGIECPITLEWTLSFDMAVFISIQTSTCFVRSIHYWTETHFLGFQTDDNAQDLVNGAVFGARPGHWLPGSIRDYFNKNLDGRDASGSFSGPGLITLLLRQSGLLGYSNEPLDIADITIFPKRYFYPYSWLETYSNDVVTPDTYTVHRWSATWISRPSIRAKIRSVFFNRLARYVPELAFRFSRMLVTKFGTRHFP